MLHFLAIEHLSWKRAIASFYIGEDSEQYLVGTNNDKCVTYFSKQNNQSVFSHIA